MWRNSSCFKLLAPKLLNPHWIRLLLCNFKTCDMFDEDLQVIQPEPRGPCAKGRPLGKLISTVHLPTSQHNQDANSASRGLKLWNAKFESADDRSAEDSQEVHMQCIHRCVWFPCYCFGWVAENVHQGPCGSKNCSFAHWQNSQFAHRAKIIQLTHTHTHSSRFNDQWDHINICVVIFWSLILKILFKKTPTLQKSLPQTFTSPIQARHYQPSACQEA